MSVGERESKTPSSGQNAPSRANLPPSSIYSEEYFLSNVCEGLEEFLDGGVSRIKRHELEILAVRSGDRVLDLGCGRGESSRELRSTGAAPIAMDYSWDAVRLTDRVNERAVPVLQGDATRLPFADGSFDRVLLGDVIEHLPWQLGVCALHEILRVLAPGGTALVHTSPNTWFTVLVMPPLRVLLRLLRRDEVLARFHQYDRLRELMHPNELNPWRIRRLIRDAGIDARTWVDKDVLRSGDSEWTRKLVASPFVRFAGRVAGTWPLRLILGNDLYALMSAPHNGPPSSLRMEPDGDH